MKSREPERHLKTSEIAKIVGAHSNTVRLYEQWGFISPVPRASNGYRLYTREHLDQMRLARLALHGGWPGKSIRESALSLVLCTASMDLRGAFAQARKHLRLVRAERNRAEKAAALLERWAERRAPSHGTMVQIGEAAKRTGLSIDMLRNWERNGLINAKRDPQADTDSTARPRSVACA